MPYTACSLFGMSNPHTHTLSLSTLSSHSTGMVFSHIEVGNEVSIDVHVECTPV